MTGLRLEVNVGPGHPGATVDFAKQVEAAGYQRLGVWDSPALYRELWVTLGAAAQATRRIVLGSNVTNPLTRHPVVTASAAATVTEIAPGRVYIGIGSGDSGVYNLGGTAASISNLKQYVLALKALLEDGLAEYQGKQVRLPWARQHIPIYISAHGPKAIQLAGEIADGVIMGLGITPEVIEGSLDLLAQGARRAGRDPDAIDVWWVAPVHIDPRPGMALHEIAWLVASPAHHLARFTLDDKFIPDHYRAGIGELAAIYDITTHGHATAQQREQYARVAHEAGILDYLIQRFFLVGTPDEVRARIRACVSAGATQLSLGSPPASDLNEAAHMAQSVHSTLST